MAKPICVVYYTEQYNSLKPGELQELLDNRMPDYHVLVVASKRDEIIEMKVFHEKDFTEIQYNELKEMIEKELSKSTNIQQND